MAENWSNSEIDLIVADYFSMLVYELGGQPYNKTMHRNSLIKLLNQRSESSIEFKHQNISAALIKLGIPYIGGYKPRWNYQHILEERLVGYLNDKRIVLAPKFEAFADTIPVQMQLINDFSQVLVMPPERSIISEPEIQYGKTSMKINYLEKEQANTILGTQGEDFVMEFEKWNLREAGKDKWADQIEWISKYNDAAGFDILSKNPDGTDKYIEVKTTKLLKETPIFFSKNEYDFSVNNKTAYHLYRVFNYSKSPKIFTVNGSFDEFCSKQVLNYKGTF